MNARIPSGTRDVLPEERAELRRIEGSLLGVFSDAGYGEVSTPTVEYQETLQRAGAIGSPLSYRVLGDAGEELALRSDMTVPIARVASSRYQGAELPLRFCYVAPAYRAVTPHRGQPREFLQAGIELIGADKAAGCSEALTVLCRALEASGLRDFYVGVGDASLYPALLASCGVAPDDSQAVLRELADRDFVGIDRELASLDLSGDQAAMLAAVPRMRGTEALAEPFDALLEEPIQAISDLIASLEADVAARMIPDLGRFPRMGYYSDVVFEVYDPALGEPIASGGYYAELLGRFEMPIGGVGFAIDVDLLHAALAGEERGETGR
ncbi:MAG: ATP phosphoribosyltransferase regulatory subunit [Solirubrobacteraceae bacterium]|jgi:ATP phosphoribosyltransferase regulatory subunit|nr:ATP phosphoribosyltransferase regulatory subunit [Solirubrobacteraceae bacterium]